MVTTVQLTIDCAHPQALAHFWTTALHYVPEPPRGRESWLTAMGELEPRRTKALGVAKALAEPGGHGVRKSR